MNDELDIYEVLLRRSDVAEIDTRELQDGMRVIGNQETVRRLAEEVVQSMISGSGGEVANAVLAKSVVAKVFPSSFGDRVMLLSPENFRLTLFHGDPILIWLDSAE
ncbi:hypothetical protein BDK89_2325 [Ilumatobacter fluminis]|uniref:Uncharacterized protein n=1 Tax=Ilumatobacter fluminis TaxID=467091 RepID=A0A4R7I0N7_9ACTN|nr:hypothetical protein [Ilumatobacter fluminis]TDT16730.1 hypothetical protein BDK89_2325 [Ilumatobacter fluminis]